MYGCGTAAAPTQPLPPLRLARRLLRGTGHHVRATTECRMNLERARQLQMTKLTNRTLFIIQRKKQ